MKRITKETVDRITLDASLQRLGVVELDERLEFSPLLVEGGLNSDTRDMQFECCSCKVPDPKDLIPRFDRPWIGDGSTGPTSGTWNW